MYICFSVVISYSSILLAICLITTNKHLKKHLKFIPKTDSDLTQIIQLTENTPLHIISKVSFYLDYANIIFGTYLNSFDCKQNDKHFI